ncbi:hypothetical protein PGRAN_02615 [Listeria grandensis FSL F6-0971]|uniref:PBSX phage terminase small subunit-like N-terminal domain-containing protein n=1 Tax=Listeria grandensis FSL F6-0971 TaxID=1265819 RepID=W7BFR2_9LIST|nr:phage terminase small subunit [Listeria grandensis]EUJ24752.1 hypothetical protein PGRAN_02615 [Listeria grandensis FSL F6-0971]
MAQKRNPLRDEAKQMWLESGGLLKLAEIAAKLEKPPSTIRKWKSQDKWDKDINESAPNDKGSAPLRSKAMLGNKNATGNKGGKGAPKGNDYAKGNAGGGAPPSNENALKTGEFRTIVWEQLSDAQKELFDSIPDDPIKQITATIKEYEVRKHGIIILLNQAREDLAEIEEQEEAAHQVDKILSIEDALTRVTNHLVKAIKQKSDLELASARKKLVQTQTDVNKEKLYRPSTVEDEKVENKAPPDMTQLSIEELRNLAKLTKLS